MKTNSSHKNNIKKNENIIQKKIKGIDFNGIAKKTGFLEREPRKISPKNFLLGFFLMVFSSANTLESWASKIGLLIHDTVSREAVNKKIKKNPVEFLRKVLQTVINRNVVYKKDQLTKAFKSILIHDSTSIKLNGDLTEYYPGNENMFPKVKKSILKIQAVYNLVKRNFRSFELTSFRENDQSKSSDILQVAKPGDLVLRDQGYFALEVFRKMINLGIYFVSRLKFPIVVSDKKTHKRINLQKLLKNKDFIDQDILLGSEETIEVRFIAIKLDKKTANERRRKARLNRDRRIHYSKLYMYLLGWRILITNLDREKYSLKQIMELYSLRFRIEVIFRCWKSYFKLKDVEQLDNKIRVETHIYSMLIFIVLFQTEFYKYLENICEEGKSVSIMKFSKYIADNLLIVLITDLLKEGIFDCIKKQLEYYCCYQTRNDRSNFYDIFAKLS